jgi:hypothetical protein
VWWLTSPEDVGASITTGGEVVVVAVGAVETVIFGSERLVHKGRLTVHALEAGLMPMLVLIRQILQHITIHILVL